MKPQYITPRLAIASLSSHQDAQQLAQIVNSKHKNYFHYFNFTQLRLSEDKQSSFKWRGLPFSLSELIKILAQIDVFLRINLANAAIICISNHHMQEYARIIAKTYLQLCCMSVQKPEKLERIQKIKQIAEKVYDKHPYFTEEISTIYRNISIDIPPLKILESFSIEPEGLFIPIFEIFTEGRYNDFQSVYHHSVEQQLANYYLNLNSPLQTGIGKRYYDQKPETKYLKHPVLVYGDVKIVVFSFKSMAKVHEFSLGFNTHNIDELNKENKAQLILIDRDLYEKNKQIATDITVKIEFSNYCDSAKCNNAAKCQQCRQTIKKLANRYSECQAQLEKLHRARTPQQISALLSL